MNFADEVLKSFQTVREMLVDRGIALGPLADVTYAELKAMADASPTFVIKGVEGVRIVYDTHAKFKFSDVRRLLEEPDIQDAKIVVLVVRDKPNAANAKMLAEAGDNVEPFEIRELLYNVSRHSLVPRHEVVRDPAEIDALMKQYRVRSKTQFPLILRSDPMARYLGVRPGELVRVTRPSPSAGEYVLYRACV